MVEWATVLTLVPAAWLCAVGVGRRRLLGGVPWFFAGLLLFCAFFAGEEISWGQRLMAYQPPEYFLEHNSQQELNVRNLFKAIVRTKVLLLGILGLYGVLLPLLNAWVPPARRLFAWLGFVVPSAMLVPAFAASFALLQDYPWKYTGEVGEPLFALCLFFAIAIEVSRLPGPSSRVPLLARLRLLSVGTTPLPG